MEDVVLVYVIIYMVWSLGLKIIVEGVEIENVLWQLCDCYCDEV